MVWKYIVIGFLLVGFVFYYPEINEVVKLPISYQTIILISSLLLLFVITPLYWRAIFKQGQKDRLKHKKAKQPWE